MRTQGLLVKANGVMERVTFDGLKSIYRHLDCRTIDVMIFEEGLDAYVDDYGKARGKWSDINVTATRLAQDFKRIDSYDMILGSILVFGGADDDGNCLDISPEKIKLIESYRVKPDPEEQKRMALGWRKGFNEAMAEMKRQRPNVIIMQPSKHYAFEEVE